MDPKPLRSNIEMKNVSFEIDETTIIDNLSLSIPCGAILVLYGPSGSGKTTILSLLAASQLATAGKILIDGVDLRKIKGEKWRKQIGIVIQDPILINATVRDNLLYANPTADDEQLIHVLKEVLLWDEKSVFPQGLDTPVGNRGELLSGGERQRLTIARSLLKEPDLLLLDEPTAMLDEDNKKKIKSILMKLAGNKIVVIATHDKSLMEIATHRVKIEAGKNVATH